MRILFHLLQPGYARNYESTIRLLASRGHEISLVYPRGLSDELSSDLPERIAAEVDGVTAGYAPNRSAYDRWNEAAWWVRALADASRFVHPRYASSHLLRERPLRRLRKRLEQKHDLLGRSVLRRLVRYLESGTSAHTSDRLVAFLTAAEDAMPPASVVTSFIADQAPDLVLVTPIVDVGSIQVEYVKSAQALGIPVGVCIASWDNLTNKGLIRVQPDRVFVWNEIQRREATELHGIAPERVVATGAQHFDEWFARKPSRSRSEFARAVGLRSSHPFLLYLCSSRFIAADEVSFVRRWLTALRASDDDLRDIPVLVRPHPQNAAQWLDEPLADLGDTTVWPYGGSDPADTGSRDDFFDSLAYSAAVVGINTSALIESAIAGKDVFTVLVPEFRGAQEGTLHFHYLLAERGGFLRVATSLDEHMAQLAAGLSGPESETRTRAFVSSFVRPRGLDRPATPILADEIETLGSGPPSAPEPRLSRGARPMVSASLLLLTSRRPTLRGSGLRTRLRREVRLALRSGLFSPLRGVVRRQPQLLEAAQQLVGRLHEPPDEIRTHMDAKRVVRNRLTRGRTKLVVGPWTGDAETELLYWIPFLRWTAHRLDLDPFEVTAVSSTGVSEWYADVAATVRTEIEAAACGSALTPDVLGPLWAMQQEARSALRELQKVTIHRRLRAPDLPAKLAVPDEYVVVDLGATPAFGSGIHGSRMALPNGIDGLPLVVLGGDEADSDIGISLPADAADRERLRSATVARSAGVVAGYGLTTHLGVLHQVPTVALYDRRGALTPTLPIVERIVRELGVPFTLLERTQLALVGSTAGVRLLARA